MPEGSSDAQRPTGVRTLLDARSEAQAVHGLEMRTELRFGVAADELRRQLNEVPNQMLILGVSNLERLSRDFGSLLVPPASCSLMIVYRPTETDRKANLDIVATDRDMRAAR
jgi:hypothetical protein